MLGLSIVPNEDILRKNMRESVGGLIVNNKENEISKPCSNSSWDSLFSLWDLGKDMNPYISPQATGQIAGQTASLG